MNSLQYQRMEKSKENIKSNHIILVSGGKKCFLDWHINIDNLFKTW